MFKGSIQKVIMKLFGIILVVFISVACNQSVMDAPKAKSIHELSFTTIDGKSLSFSSFKGKKILIVNTASKCGYTSQYKSLEELHQKYKDELVIIGFPANNFMGQEPGSNTEIAEFCQKNYGVSFLMSEKISVNGKDVAPLFAWLTTQENPDFTGNINWNFEKFLLDGNGKLIRRFRSGVNPVSEEMLKALGKL